MKKYPLIHFLRKMQNFSEWFKLAWFIVLASLSVRITILVSSTINEFLGFPTLIASFFLFSWFSLRFLSPVFPFIRYFFVLKKYKELILKEKRNVFFIFLEECKKNDIFFDNNIVFISKKMFKELDKELFRYAKKEKKRFWAIYDFLVALGYKKSLYSTRDYYKLFGDLFLLVEEISPANEGIKRYKTLLDDKRIFSHNNDILVNDSVEYVFQSLISEKLYPLENKFLLDLGKEVKNDFYKDNWIEIYNNSESLKRFEKEIHKVLEPFGKFEESLSKRVGRIFPHNSSDYAYCWVDFEGERIRFDHYVYEIIIGGVK